MKSIMECIGSAIDWTSIKLAGACSPFAVINLGQIGQVNVWNGVNVATITAYLGAAVMLSTLLYNGIRIYKELKNKK